MRSFTPYPSRTASGVHLTRDLGGRTRAGPDAYLVTDASTRLDRLDPDEWDAKAEDFAKQLRRFLPGIEARHLTPDQAGVRPKLLRDGASDFRLLAPGAAGTPGMAHLLGVESPGLTACLALGEWTADALSLNS